MLQIDSRRDVAGPSSGMDVVGDVVLEARVFVGAEARALPAATRPGIVAIAVGEQLDAVRLLSMSKVS